VIGGRNIGRFAAADSASVTAPNIHPRLILKYRSIPSFNIRAFADPV
jgi:hypothetical protein